MDRVLTGLRPYAPSDLNSIVRLLELASAWPPSGPANPADLTARWARMHVDPEHDINILTGPEGDVVAFSRGTLLTDSSPRLSMEIAVRPDFRGRGIGSALYSLLEERARNLKSVHITTPVYLSAGETRPDTTRFLQNRNFYPDSSYWQMRIDNLTAQPPPEPIVNITIRSFGANVERDAERWAELIRVSFRESASGPRVIAQLAEAGSSPAGYFFAVDTESGLEIGTSRGRIDMANGVPTGYVGTVGVLPEYRGRGIARALILRTLQYLHERGTNSATLFVEANNYNARRLYEWMGWRPTYQTVHYWKNLNTSSWQQEQ